jgi:hypothetical protein
MADDERSLEGWTPVAGEDAALAEIVDHAFDYRGDVTLIRVDGTTLAGYLYNRNADGDEPYVQLFDPAGASHTVRYVELVTIHFTGRDTAAGKSYEAWLRRKAETAAAHGA